MKKLSTSKTKMSLHTQTLRNLNSSELSAANGGGRSGVACYLSDLAALTGISTTGTICPND
jgi:hypothetical protein